MNSDKNKRNEDVPVEEVETDDGAIVEDRWSKVDLHNRKKTPEADMASDVEPPAG